MHLITSFKQMFIFYYQSRPGHEKNCKYFVDNIIKYLRGTKQIYKYTLKYNMKCYNLQKIALYKSRQL